MDSLEARPVDDLIDAATEVRIRAAPRAGRARQAARGQGVVGRPAIRRPHPELARGLGDRDQGTAHRLGRSRRRIFGRGRRALPRVRFQRRPPASARCTSISRVRNLTPSGEAALVLPRGNTWTCEASHEFSNVDGPRNLDFWFEVWKRGSPLKIFPLLGSAVPPTAYEWGCGYFGYDEQKRFMAESLMVAGLGRGDGPGPRSGTQRTRPTNVCGGMIEATFAARGRRRGPRFGSPRPLLDQRPFAAAVLASDHEVQTPEETWDKLTRGLFIELRIYAMPEINQVPLGTRPRGLVADRVHDRRSQRLAHVGARRDRSQRAAGDRKRARAGNRHPVRDDQPPPGTCG